LVKIKFSYHEPAQANSLFHQAAVALGDYIYIYIKRIFMTTLTIKINERNSLGKAIIELLRSTAKESSAIKLVETKEENSYNPEFVEKVLKAAASKKRHRIDPKNLWESL